MSATSLSSACNVIAIMYIVLTWLYKYETYKLMVNFSARFFYKYIYYSYSRCAWFHILLLTPDLISFSIIGTSHGLHAIHAVRVSYKPPCFQLLCTKQKGVLIRDLIRWALNLLTGDKPSFRTGPQCLTA
jgi:hypothetical protein